jgi:hypothetical protein
MASTAGFIVEEFLNELATVVNSLKPSATFSQRAKALRSLKKVVLASPELLDAAAYEQVALAVISTDGLPSILLDHDRGRADDRRATAVDLLIRLFPALPAADRPGRAAHIFSAVRAAFASPTEAAREATEENRSKLLQLLRALYDVAGPSLGLYAGDMAVILAAAVQDLPKRMDGDLMVAACNLTRFWVDHFTSSALPHLMELINATFVPLAHYKSDVRLPATRLYGRLLLHHVPKDDGVAETSMFFLFPKLEERIFDRKGLVRRSAYEAMRALGCEHLDRSSYRHLFLSGLLGGLGDAAMSPEDLADLSRAHIEAVGAQWLEDELERERDLLETDLAETHGVTGPTTPTALDLVRSALPPPFHRLSLGTAATDDDEDDYDPTEPPGLLRRPSHAARSVVRNAAPRLLSTLVDVATGAHSAELQRRDTPEIRRAAFIRLSALVYYSEEYCTAWMQQLVGPLLACLREERERGVVAAAHLLLRTLGLWAPFSVLRESFLPSEEPVDAARGAGLAARLLGEDFGLLGARLTAVSQVIAAPGITSFNSSLSCEQIERLIAAAGSASAATADIRVLSGALDLLDAVSRLPLVASDAGYAWVNPDQLLGALVPFMVTDPTALLVERASAIMGAVQQRLGDSGRPVWCRALPFALATVSRDAHAFSDVIPVADAAAAEVTIREAALSAASLTEQDRAALWDDATVNFANLLSQRASFTATSAALELRPAASTLLHALVTHGADCGLVTRSPAELIAQTIPLSQWRAGKQPQIRVTAFKTLKPLFERLSSPSQLGGEMITAVVKGMDDDAPAVRTAAIECLSALPLVTEADQDSPAAAVSVDHVSAVLRALQAVLDDAEDAIAADGTAVAVHLFASLVDAPDLVDAPAVASAASELVNKLLIHLNSARAVRTACRDALFRACDATRHLAGNEEADFVQTAINAALKRHTTQPELLREIAEHCATTR